MDYPLQTALQLSSHLRALRKSRRLSQAQVGAALGVGQTRVARIERDPAAIGVEQLMELLSVLGVQLVLRDLESPGRADASATVAKGSTGKRRTPDADW